MKKLHILVLMLAGMFLFSGVKLFAQNEFGQGTTYDEIMRNDHKEISSLLDQLAQAKADHQQKKELLMRLRDGIAKHMKAEEDYLYPRLKKTPDAKATAVRAEDEHMAAKAELAKLNPDEEDAVFSSRLEVLKTLIDGHVTFEESQLLDKAKSLSDQDKISEQFKKVYGAKASSAKY